MKNIMPSQVVSVVLRLFPHVTVARPGDGFLHSGQLDQLLGIANLVKEIPSELMTVSVADYADLVLALTSIEENNKFRISRGAQFGLPAIQGKDFATIIYDVLVKCPDEYPPKSTIALTFIGDVDLRENIERDIEGIERAISHAEWKAATVLAGSVIEALLLWRLSEPLPGSAAVESARLGVAPGANVDPLWWDLFNYAKVARELDLIEDETFREAELARGYRNLIHPGKSARLQQHCDRGTAYAAVAALDHVVRDLSP
jgi:hypothetical protein